jgi:hypothetical protein
MQRSSPQHSATDHTEVVPRSCRLAARTLLPPLRAAYRCRRQGQPNERRVGPSGLSRCGRSAAAHGRTTPRARPVDDHVGLRAGRAHTNTEAAHPVIPRRKLATIALKAVHSALGDLLGCHG